ncbi:MAG: hypothetical protein NDI61_12310 [Bdellovibrionaceae bacterium]|nr:hypothetical protein [Pseudobdellovibrionaceae bacterium]
MTPDSVEKKWDEWEARCIGRLSGTGDWGRLLGLAVLMLTGVFLILANWSHTFPSWARMNLAQDRTWILVSLVTLGFFTPWVPRRFLGPYFIFSFITSWIVSASLLQAASPAVLVFPAYLLVNGGMLSWLACRPTSGRTAMTLFVVTLGFGACMWSAGWVAMQGHTSYLQFFWLMHPQGVLWLAFALIAGVKSPGARDLTLKAWSPSQVGYSVPLAPETEVRSGDRRLWWMGWWNILFAMLLLRIVIAMALSPLPAHRAAQALFLYGYFCVYVVASMNVIAGTLRLFGVAVPDATRFLFLSATPLEIWRRSFTYMYQFMFQVVFLPVYRVSRSLIVTGVLTAMVIGVQMFLFHEVGVRAFYSLFFSQLASVQVEWMHVLVDVGAYIVGWLILILLYRATLQKFFVRRGWIGASWCPVLSTHVLIVILVALLEISFFKSGL